MSVDPPPKDNRDRPPRDTFRRLPTAARFMVGAILGVAVVALALAIYALIERSEATPLLEQRVGKIVPR